MSFLFGGWLVGCCFFVRYLVWLLLVFLFRVLFFSSFSVFGVGVVCLFVEVELVLFTNFFISVGVGVGVVVGSEGQNLGTILFWGVTACYPLYTTLRYRIYTATYGLICIGTYILSTGLYILFSTVECQTVLKFFSQINSEIDFLYW